MWEKKITPNNWFHDINTTEQTNRKDPTLQTDWKFLNSTRISLFKSYAAKNITEKFTNLFKNQTWDLTLTMTLLELTKVTSLPPTKKIYQHDQPHSRVRSTSIYFAENFVVFFFSIFVQKVTRDLRKSWKQH